jgi:site-specific DNA-cytosine methylase
VTDLRALGCFIFAGGFALGVRQAGFEVVGHLEGSDYGVATFKNFFPKVPVWQHPATWPTKRFKGVPFVYANPPCAIWSVAGSSMTKGRSNWLHDPRTSCIRHVMKLLTTVEPKVLVWESVTQAWTRGRGLLRELEKEALRLGYSVTYCFTSAELHGVPQPRQRFLMFCHKLELPIERPTTHPRNVQDVLGLRETPHGWVQSVPTWGEWEISPVYSRLFRCLMQGEMLRAVSREIKGVDERELENPDESLGEEPAFMVRRLSLRGRGSTFTSACFEVHPIYHRWLMNSEVAALGGWPYHDREMYRGDVQEVRAQLTQCVLPPVGEWVASVARRSLEMNRPEVEPRVCLVSHCDGRDFKL